MKSSSPWNEGPSQQNASPQLPGPSNVQIAALMPEGPKKRRAALLRLTDECQAAIREAIKHKRRVNLKVNDKTMTIVVENGTSTPAKFTCSEQRLPGAVDSICHDASGAFRSVASIGNKFVVNPTERTFSETREKMQKLAEEEQRKSAQKIDFVNTKPTATKRPFLKTAFTSNKTSAIKPFASKPTISSSQTSTPKSTAAVHASTAFAPTRKSHDLMPIPTRKPLAAPSFSSPSPKCACESEKPAPPIRKPIEQTKSTNSTKSIDSTKSVDAKKPIETSPPLKKPRMVAELRTNNGKEMKVAKPPPLMSLQLEKTKINEPRKNQSLVSAPKPEKSTTPTPQQLPIKSMQQYERDYPPITDTKQAIHYHETFEKDYPIYRRCHERISRVSNEFNDLKQRLDRTVAGSTEQSAIIRRIEESYDRYKADHNYAENRRRHAELHSKLIVLKRRLTAYEQQSQLFTPPSSSSSTTTPATPNSSTQEIYAYSLS
ncbi:hypothetical protein M3Y98_00778400 [Aphelenchoides besseyi]|nr:hypothetical protein M3Y98_00778400 [Aphelenchoides besseyi]